MVYQLCCIKALRIHQKSTGNGQYPQVRMRAQKNALLLECALRMHNLRNPAFCPETLAESQHLQEKMEVCISLSIRIIPAER